MSRNDIYLAIALNIAASILFIVLFQRATVWIRNGLLGIFTFGRNRLKDVFYASVATGFYSSTNHIVAGVGLLLCLVITTSGQIVDEQPIDSSVRLLSALNMFAL